MTLDLIMEAGGVCQWIMKKKYPVILTDAQRKHLKSLIAAGTASARKLTHARILLKADQRAPRVLAGSMSRSQMLWR